MNFVWKALLYPAVIARLTTMAGVAAAQRMEDGDPVLLLTMFPGELAARLDAIGGVAGLALAVTGKDFGDKVLGAGLGTALLVLLADRKLEERRRFG
ncbi:hypothetical protein KIPE111705_05960 [Kibdelosporangium persicum]|uniref:Uncharacterized protein n=1 Tax=Kibdelosporangium persicum TaxID=2698649 RepID=A0ABX2F2N5_9PSEU|nr:hypothetical protein [Kibdelosporangium persicum]NRN65576.1 hypothetical protein [Kibdelosporangium persicum]